MAPAFYKINGRPINPIAWGDYGDILQHGMTAHLPQEGGKLCLERTGPYVPPITLPGIGDLVLTLQAQKLLKISGLTGFSFLPVVKKHIVELHWEDWNLDADEPPEYPETGEPEDYILLRPHSPEIADVIGELWEVVVPPTATIIRPPSTVRSYRDLQLDLSTWNGADLIRSNGFGSILFSERACNWFTERWGEYVEFDEFPTN